MKRLLKSGKSHNTGLSLNILTEDECHEIHLATLELLKETGVYCESEEALDIFGGNGCDVYQRRRIVKFPHWVVEDAIRAAPASFHCYGRQPEDDVVLEDNRVTFMNFGEGIQFVDPYSGERRESTKADLADTIRVIDQLEHLDTCLRAMCSHDKPTEVQALHNAEAILTNTTKPIWIGPVNRYQAEKIVAMCTAIVGGKDELRKRPLLSFASCPISPLKLPQDLCDIVMSAARNGLGMMVVGMAMAGGSSPVHLAGTLVLQNCELLATLVLNQLACKGARFLYGSSTCPMDLRLATSAVGSPETGMISAAVARLARYYSLPSLVAGG
jgi:trimethylamine--corrinoid protein Co-methyltransferase